MLVLWDRRTLHVLTEAPSCGIVQWGVPLVIHCIDIALWLSAEHKCINCLIMSVGARQVQRGVLGAVHCIDVCPTVQEKQLSQPREREGVRESKGRR